MDIRKEWLRKRLDNVSVSDDFNYDLILAQTKSLCYPFLSCPVKDCLVGWPIAEVDQLIRLTIEAAYWRFLE